MAPKPVSKPRLAEIAERRNIHREQVGLTRVLQQMADGGTLPRVLTTIVQFTEEAKPGAIASVLLLDAAAGCLRHGAAVSLPDRYWEALDGLAIEPHVGSCGEAAFTGKRVIAKDIFTHPSWRDHRDLADQSTMRSCWSEPIIASGGGVLGIFAIYHRHPGGPDATERAFMNHCANIARLAIEHVEAYAAARRLAAIVESTSDAVMGLRLDGIIESWNPAAQAIYGYTAAEAIGQPVDFMLPPDRADELPVIFDRIRRGERTDDFETLRRTKSGRLIHVSLSVAPILGPDGVVTGVSKISRDISERKRAEEQIHRTDRLAAIGTLAAGLGHDMNNLLLPVRARMDIIEAADLDASVATHLAEIRKATDYLQDLADGLHLLALDPDDAEASAATTNLQNWWQHTQALLRRAVSKPVQLVESMGTNLPEIAVAPHRLTQVILNLLVNSQQAVGQGGCIRLWAEVASDSMVHIGVTDDGPGMSPEVKRRAMDPFFTTKIRGLGTGLGLAMVHGVARSVNGTVDIQSEVGKGTTITLAFPSVSTPRTFADPSSLTPPSALVTVSDHRTATLVTHILEASGLVVYADTDEPRDEIAVWVTDSGKNAPSILRKKTRVVVMLGATTGERVGGECIVVDDPSKFDALRVAIGKATERVFQ